MCVCRACVYVVHVCMLCMCVYRACVYVMHVCMSLTSDVWKVGSYLNEVEEKRERLISNLSLQQQKVWIYTIVDSLHTTLLLQELGYSHYNVATSAAKRIRLDPEITEDGIYEFHIQYNK